MRNATSILLAVVLSVAASYATVRMTAPQNGAASVTSTEAKKESAYDRVIRTGTIRCGYGISPPALVMDPNTKQLSGVDYDIWEAIGKELGLKIEWAEEAGWGNFIEGLRSNRYDAFCSQLWPDPARSKFLTMAGPVTYSLLNAYVRADDMRFDSNTDAINDPAVTFPAIDGDVSMAIAQNHFPKAKILTLPQTATLSDIFMSITTKKADVVVMAPMMFEDLNKSNPNQLRQVQNVPSSVVYTSYYGFNAGETELRDMVDLALRTLINDGRLEKMAHSYSSTINVSKKDY
jgi:ABC-type amino acid transport substrate-binding protein